MKLITVLPSTYIDLRNALIQHGHDELVEVNCLHFGEVTIECSEPLEPEGGHLKKGFTIYDGGLLSRQIPCSVDWQSFGK
jgi:hypothetical protein